MRRTNIAPWGGIALLIAVAAGPGPAAARAQEPENPFTSRIDVRMGGRSYRSQCATCHGINATGNPEAGGPDLSTGLFSRAEGDAGLFRVIRDGIEGTAMIGLGADAAEQSVWQLVTFLRSLAPAGIDPGGSAAAGEALFAGSGGCARCHMVNGEGGRLGPDLSFVGDRRTPGELEADLVDPDADVLPRWWTITATGPGGETVEGLRMNEDTFTFRIMDADENLRAFSKYGAWSYERTEASTMPGYAGTLTARERTDLVAYLYSLRRDR
jgi:putative heme-binding domain-containing protein